MQQMIECDADRLSELFALHASVWIEEGADPEAFPNGLALPPELDWPRGLEGLRQRIDEEFEKPDTQAVRVRGNRRSWTSATVIFKLVQDLFPDKAVLHRHWPACLFGRESGTD